MAYSFKGAISFGLVYIPITLSNSVRENDIGFNLIDKKTMSRVKYKKTCVDCDEKEVKNENIVKGYQYEKDKYVIFTDEELEKIKSVKDKNITIEHFVNLDEVDPIYYDKSYYVEPDGSDRAFLVLLEAMQKQKKAGIAKTVLGTKETLLLIRARNGKMLVNTLYFNDEIQESPQIKKLKIQKQELDLATTLINQMTSKFEPEKYKDEYNEKIKKAIKQKIAGKKIVTSKNSSKPVKIIDLMDALKKSVNSKSNSKSTKNNVKQQNSKTTKNRKNQKNSKKSSKKQEKF